LVITHDDFNTGHRENASIAALISLLANYISSFGRQQILERWKKYTQTQEFSL
jgi:hypothetical protein